MCDKAEKDPEATVLTSNPVSGTGDRQGSCPESLDTLGSSTGMLARMETLKAGASSSSASSSSPHAAGEKSQFYIEVDADSMANLKAGTQYTLVPMDADQATAAAIPTSGIAQTLAWGRTLDGRLPGEEAAGNPRVVSKEELTRDALGLDQGMMNTFDATGKTEVPDQPLDAEFEGSENKMTYTPLMPVPLQQQQQQQQTQAHEATAAAAAAAQMQHATNGYDAAELRYRHPTSPMYSAPPQHTLPHQTTFLVPPRGSWTPFTGTTTAQAYLPLATGSHSCAAACAAAGLAGGPCSSSGAATAAGSGLHASLGADEVTSAGHFGRSATGEATGGDIMSGVTRVANMGQMQHMVGPLVNVPYYMPFHGRENHNEKERKRRARIKNACQTLRSLVPGLSEKTDKATVFEFTVQYLLHLRRHLGTKRDKSISQEFMEKYSPY
ncbi:hypothetical protein HPB52_007112 [Rhipicephalus sanguineus]|uniref:BHLH domain-containing protein n=2 Tax=Rhipicephalus sanguineus TaxID=34632 RepID=A0A9D4QIB1_RHISA|nr:hypothetical protein HPB52_007112 [Rhipicephalus sanguineus]